ncbi:MAG: PHP domain-containing protein [Verrucomicrobiota bacterium]|nr:PHP domain-containing protein [Verrucomicrobiota bacterium]
MIDLHVHSTFSDGSLTPADLAQAGESAGLTAMALTDHDTVSGVEPFLEACRARAAAGGRAVRGLAGVEINANVSCGALHMLGYGMNPRHPGLTAALERIRRGRLERNMEIAAKLRGLGVAVTLEDASAFAGGEVVGRPHFALALQAKGYVRSVKEAFDRFLANGKPAYADRFRFSAEDSIRVILDAGGVPALAHPFTLTLDREALKRYVGELCDMGLQGIEVYYTEHSPGQTEEYLGLARVFNLLATGGSDYHGAAAPDIRLGNGFGNLTVPDDLLDGILRRLAERPPGAHVSHGSVKYAR